MTTSGRLSVCLAGATGWAGSELARGIVQSQDLDLSAAVSRTHAGQDLGEVLGDGRVRCPIYSSATAALASRCEVFVDYTKPEVAKTNILAALEHGTHVVVGTSGLTDDDYSAIDAVARERERGVLAVGNFALTVVLMQKFAEMAAKWIPQWEIIDYAHDDKIDAPSGTARELATRLSRVRKAEPTVSVEQTVGEREARSATVSGVQVHSVRLPGYVISAEVIFGMPDQRLKAGRTLTVCEGSVFDATRTQILARMAGAGSRAESRGTGPGGEGRFLPPGPRHSGWRWPLR